MHRFQTLEGRPDYPERRLLMPVRRTAMSQRPLFWAIGILASTCLGVLNAAPQLLALSGGAQGTSAPERKAPVIAAIQPVHHKGTLAVAADHRGQFVVHPQVDGFRVKMLVDTGASLIALTDVDARNLGVKLSPSDYNLTLKTANGVVKGAQVMLKEIRMGDIVVRNVEATVLPPQVLEVSLLGTSFLKRLAGYEVSAGKLILRS
jgi:aspartyl protease family protein